MKCRRRFPSLSTDSRGQALVNVLIGAGVVVAASTAIMGYIYNGQREIRLADLRLRYVQLQEDVQATLSYSKSCRGNLNVKPGAGAASTVPVTLTLSRKSWDANDATAVTTVTLDPAPGSAALGQSEMDYQLRVTTLQLKNLKIFGTPLSVTSDAAGLPYGANLTLMTADLEIAAQSIGELFNSLMQYSLKTVTIEGVYLAVDTAAAIVDCYSSVDARAVAALGCQAMGGAMQGANTDQPICLFPANTRPNQGCPPGQYVQSLDYAPAGGAPLNCKPLWPRPIGG